MKSEGSCIQTHPQPEVVGTNQKISVCIHWFISGSHPGKCFKGTWLSIWQMGRKFSNPVEEKKNLYNISEETGLWKCVDRRGQNSTIPPTLLIPSVQFHSCNPAVSQCDKISLAIIPFLIFCQILFVSRHQCDLNATSKVYFADDQIFAIKKKHWVLSAIVQESLWIWWRSEGLKGERKKLKLTVCSKISSRASNTIACLAEKEDSHRTALPPAMREWA